MVVVVVPRNFPLCNDDDATTDELHKPSRLPSTCNAAHDDATTKYGLGVRGHEKEKVRDNIFISFFCRTKIVFRSARAILLRPPLQVLRPSHLHHSLSKLSITMVREYITRQSLSHPIRCRPVILRPCPFPHLLHSYLPPASSISLIASYPSPSSAAFR